MKKNDDKALAQKMTAHILPHTHWDREWRYPIWRSRTLLVRFMRDLLRILDADPEYRCFLLDGQTVPVDDYLEVAPEDREKLTGYIRDGRIAIGPWYTLPDLYPVDGECLVRNLLKGTRAAAAYGRSLGVGYNSFGWGQTAQFPQIYAGFGINFIVCAKRVSRERAPQSEFIWRGPDGTEALATRLGEHARANFYFNAYLPAKYGVNCFSSDFRYTPRRSGCAIHNAAPENRDDDFFMTVPSSNYDADRLADGYKDALSATDDTACETHRLFLNGTDYSAPQSRLTEMIRDLAAREPSVEFRHSRLEEYEEALRANVCLGSLKTVEGELRDGPASEVSGNALSTRSYLKIANRRAESALLKLAEPLCSALAATGRPYPGGMLAKAWDYMFKSHPHDSINGVTQDKTADDVERRLAQAREIAEALLEDAAADLAASLNLDGDGVSQDDAVLMIYNPHPYGVNAVTQVSVAAPAEENIWEFGIEEMDGTPLGVQETARDEKIYPVHDTEARPWPYATHRHLAWIETGLMPAMGYKAVKVVPKQRFGPNRFYWLPMRREAPGNILVGNHVLENEHIRAEVAPNGTLNITCLADGKTYRGLHYFEDAGDVGNYWAYYPPYHNRVVTSLGSPVRIFNEENGPLCATVGVEYEMRIPASAEESAYGVRGKGARSEQAIPLVITSRFTLKRGSRQLEARTTLKNTADYHRLRVAFPTGIDAVAASAGGHFTVDERPRLNQPAADGAYWPEMQTLPMQGFVDISDGEGGLAIISDNFFEYEYAADAAGTAYLTMFRAMGNAIVTWWEAVSRHEGRVGSQMRRDMEFRYAIYPHRGDWAKGETHRQLDALRGLLCWQLAGGAHGRAPSSDSFASIDNPCVIMSAFKMAEDSGAFIMRLYNPSKETQSCVVRFGFPVESASYCDLGEEAGAPLALSDGAVSLDLAQNKIASLRIVAREARP